MSLRASVDSIRTAGAKRLARLYFRPSDRVGSGLRVEGRPSVGNLGRMVIGDRFHFVSSPSPSHLYTGPAGVMDIGNDVSIGHGAAITALVGIRIGDGTRIAPYVIIMDTDFHAVADREGAAESTPTTIGRNVRIGDRVTVLRGSDIGDGAVVMAGSVVSGKVAPGARVAGVPARVAVKLEDGAASDVGAGVVKLVVESFGLVNFPRPDEGPSQIPQWDSLGSLRLLLALEEAFAVTLAEDEVMRVKSIADLTNVVDRAVAARSRQG